MKTSLPAAPVIPKNVVQTAVASLDQWTTPLAGLKAALLVTPDGFEITSIVRGELNLIRLAATTSSLVAMTRAVSRELNFSSCRRLVFDTDQGSVVIQPIEAKFPCHLCLVLKAETVLGSALWAMGEIAREMSAIE